MSTVIDGQVKSGVLRLEVGLTRLDAASARQFRKQIDDLWSDGIQAVEMDFDRVEFIDSSGVGALLGVYKRLPQPEASVRLLRVKSPVQSVIELLRLHRIFEMAK